MGWEWRVFSDSSKEDFSNLKKKSSVEQRTDVYILLPNHPEFGLKLRGENKLELKIRIDKNKIGVEKWEKVLKIQVEKKIKIFQICEALKKQKQNACAEALKEDEKNVKFSIVKKRRYTDNNIEIAQLKVIYTSKYPISEEELNEIKPLYFKSVCIEGFSEKEVSKIAEKYRKNDLLSSNPQGYNEFLSQFSK
eukprot:gene11816-5147_t